MMKLAQYNMIEQQLRPEGVLDQAILDHVAAIKREDFVPSAYRSIAYAGLSIPLDHQQVMLEPALTTKIVQSLHIKPTDTVLEIGTGTGYLTALLAMSSKFVRSVDIFSDFTATAKKNLQNAGINNIELTTEDASVATAACFKNTYDIIVVTAALPERIPHLEQALREHGKLFTILGSPPAMAATITTKNSANLLVDNIIFETMIPSIISSKMKRTFKF